MSATPSILSGPSEHAADSFSVEPDAQEFCKRHQLTAKVSETVRLLRDAFPANTGVEVALKHDPEAADVCWLAVTIRAQGRPGALVRAYDAFLDQWIAATPPQVRDRMTPNFTIA